MSASRILGASILLSILAACSAERGGGSELEEDAVTVAKGSSMLGNDRVADLLRKDTTKIPTNLAEVEAAFGIGRECARVDSKEIFVLEESQGRLPDGEVVGVKEPIPLLPRAVISGCNKGDLRDPGTMANSYSMFVALVSDPDLAKAHGGDGMVTEPVEIIARDRTTNLYNFYVFGKNDAGTAQLTRVFRNADGSIVERRLVAGDHEASPAGQTEKKCFSCHVNGAPLMNEMRDPWTNWISFKKNIPLSEMSGTTAQLVSEAAPNHVTGRSALANDLEPVMRAAIRSYVRGWADGVKKGAGGVAQLFDSTFCETELNYASSTDAVPMEVYLDPELAWGDLIPPQAFDSVFSPFQFPIRSEFDHSVERWLEDNGYLTRQQTQAIRLLDDENDIFSDARCKPFQDGLRKQLKDEAAGLPAAADATRLVGAYLSQQAADATFKESQPKRFALLSALVDTTSTPEALAAARGAYAQELLTRFPTLVRDAQRLPTRELDRKQRALLKFPGPSSPLPLLTQRVK
jgi:hypothetical protein